MAPQLARRRRLHATRPQSWRRPEHHPLHVPKQPSRARVHLRAPVPDELPRHRLRLHQRLGRHRPAGRVKGNLMALVQAWPAPTSGNTSAVITETGPVTTAGNTLFVSLVVRSEDVDSVTITDDGGNTWTEVDSHTDVLM